MELLSCTLTLTNTRVLLNMYEINERRVLATKHEQNINTSSAKIKIWNENDC